MLAPKSSSTSASKPVALNSKTPRVVSIIHQARSVRARRALPRASCAASPDCGKGRLGLDALMCTSTPIMGERQGGGGGAESSSGAAMKAKTAAAPAAAYDPDAAQRDAALKALPGPRLEAHAAQLRAALEAADALIAARKRTAAEAAAAEAARAAAAAKLCAVCWAAPKDTVLAPCGHKCVCGPCAANIRPQICPICRAPIASAVRVVKSPRPSRPLPLLTLSYPSYTRPSPK